MLMEDFGHSKVHNVFSACPMRHIAIIATNLVSVHMSFFLLKTAHCQHEQTVIPVTSSKKLKVILLLME